MPRLRVFIASSSEGLEIANAAQGYLLASLRDTDVRVWNWEFDLSATYIESLEKVSNEADFAVLVLTPDDVTTSRVTQTLAPRDNVIFELGLFMGRLGRDRCFILCEDRPDLKLPTDLLGVKSAAFQRDAAGATRRSLEAQCATIGARVAALGFRLKFDQAELAAQSAIRAFCTRVQGSWWERISREDPVAMGFVRIEADPMFNTACLKAGKSFDKRGVPIANWKSLLAGVDVDRYTIRYLWSGWFSTPELADSLFQGFGDMEFDKPADAKGPILRGSSRFWDLDESHPEQTKVKPSELRRLTDPGAIATMSDGSEKEVRALVRKTLLEW
jgi:Predicted nucleotide-binding protein containing TIR-like domain